MKNKNKSEKPIKSDKASTESLENLASKTKSKKSDKSAAEHIAKRVTNKKDLKYNYPEEIDTLSKRKAFRTQKRKELDRLKKQLHDAKKGKGDVSLEAAEKALRIFKKKTYNQDKEAAEAE